MDRIFSQSLRESGMRLYGRQNGQKSSRLNFGLISKLVEGKAALSAEIGGKIRRDFVPEALIVSSGPLP
ncbi:MULTISPECIES: hypothetical protein [unclassified Mesorhizobium]|uniref:hypothetical protein n=1 Tax=unclassified Mesorhizobium TaxID=325217 RepID=UPI00333991DC